MRIAICEDDRYYVESLRQYITDWKLLRGYQDIAIDEYMSAEDFMDAWDDKYRCDLLFLDIKMPDGMSGFDLARIIHNNNDKVIIVFVTNLSTYVYDGYSVEALRYIVKPYSPQKITEVLDIAYDRFALKRRECLFIETKTQLMAIPVHEIIYAEIFSHTVVIHKADGEKTEFRMRFSELLSKLPKEMFSQVHRGIIVNVSAINRLNKNSVELISGNTVPLSKKYYEKVHVEFRAFYQGRC